MTRIRAWQAALVVSSTALWGQEGLSVSDPAWKGIEIRFVTKVEPPSENTSNRLPGAVHMESGRVRHIIQDREHKRYFGYEVRLEPSEDGNTAQLRIEPANPPSTAAAPDWTLLALPKYPVIPGVKLGDTVALDLLVNPATGQKIVDYLTLRRRGVTPDGAHDFSLADIELSLKRPRVWVNGKLAEGIANFQGGTSGAVVWLYLAGHGRFVLSLFPNEKLGFQKNGLVEREILLFGESGTEYRVECGSAIAPGSGPYNLYVVHEGEWRLGAMGEPFMIGSADKPEYVVGKH